MDRISRTSAGADRRLPWEDLFYSGSFEQAISPAMADNFSQTLEMVRLAPSASNKQPWRILRQDDLWHFYIQRTKKYAPPLFDFLLGLPDLQRIDIGIAMAHFELSAVELGQSGKWVIQDPGLPLPNPGLEYNITWVNGIGLILKGYKKNSKTI